MKDSALKETILRTHSNIVNYLKGGSFIPTPSMWFTSKGVGLYHSIIVIYLKGDNFVPTPLIVIYLKGGSFWASNECLPLKDVVFIWAPAHTNLWILLEHQAVFKKDPALLKVHKNENFFGFDFEFCTISLLVMHK
jgi:hypothetical protein